MTIPRSNIQKWYTNSRMSTQKSLLWMVSCISIGIGLLLILYEMLWMYWLPGMLMTHNTESITYITGDDTRNGNILVVKTHNVTRRRPDQLYKYDPKSGQNIPNTPMDAILQGHFTLIDIKIKDDIDLLPSMGIDDVTEQFYSGVIATFCHISWELQNDINTIRSKISTFHDLQEASILCPGTKIDVDFWDMVQQIRKYDHDHSNTTTNTMTIVSKPTAVIFHESKCGSTLMTNTLSSFHIPHHTRVYVEARSPLVALHACELHTSDTNRKCTKSSHIALIQDIFYVMGRINRSNVPQYVFHKIHSSGTQSIDAFIQAMPTTPWVFVYRDSIEVMMGHFSNQYMKQSPNDKDGSILSILSSRQRPDCLQNYGKPLVQQPPILVELVTKVNKVVSRLSQEEYCAAHIAGLATAAIREHERIKNLAVDMNTHAVTAITANSIDGIKNEHHSIVAPPHWFVNYNTLPHVIWETFLPSLLVNPIQQDDINNMRSAASMKVHKKKKRTSDPTSAVEDQHWNEDITLKQGLAPKSIKDAVQLFLDPVYDEMESIRKNNHM